ncbi:hypothetical protein SAMN05444156_3222 [Verrucomicrobium sp. GAS474]|uniref:hypothetical protein n=1 Tax=Verrucomicrobium sp. GAS474 TaxID=1882831 RepID=UPI0008799942|nr:hypothetical protein [Verrucomicrobium sp. GAS474]SDU31121.1 hypothetical protein SAMN05444156_3222 [Verrucomicrobium sp. GAS474]
MSHAPKCSASEAISDSFLHGEHFLLGRELLPFSLRHFLLLKSFDSPVLLGGMVGFRDIQLAVRVCSTGSDKELRDSLKRPSLRWRLWERYTRYLNVSVSLKAFSDYFDDYLPPFPFWPTPGQGESRCEPYVVCAARLVGSGADRDKVMNMGLGEVVTWSLAKIEAEGHELKTLMTDTEVEILRKYDRMEADGTAPWLKRKEAA